MVVLIVKEDVGVLIKVVRINIQFDEDIRSICCKDHVDNDRNQMSFTYYRLTSTLSLIL